MAQSPGQPSLTDQLIALQAGARPAAGLAARQHYREAARLARRAAGYEGAPGEARAQDARLAIACALLAIAAALTGEGGQ